MPIAKGSGGAGRTSQLQYARYRAAQSRGHAGAAQVLRVNKTPPRRDRGLAPLVDALRAIDRGFAFPGLSREKDDPFSVRNIRARNQQLERVVRHPLRDVGATAGTAAMLFGRGRAGRVARGASKEARTRVPLRMRALGVTREQLERNPLAPRGERARDAAWDAAKVAGFLAGGNAAVGAGIWGQEKLFGPTFREGPLFGPGLRFWELPRKQEAVRQQSQDKRRLHDRFADEIGALVRSGQMKAAEGARAVRWADKAKPWELGRARGYLRDNYSAPRGGWGR
jgi:hypothetical protein